MVAGTPKACHGQLSVISARAVHSVEAGTRDIHSIIAAELCQNTNFMEPDMFANFQFIGQRINKVINIRHPEKVPSFPSSRKQHGLCTASATLALGTQHVAGRHAVSTPKLISQQEDHNGRCGYVGGFFTSYASFPMVKLSGYRQQVRWFWRTACGVALG